MTRTKAIKQSLELEHCAEMCHECQDACLRLVPHCLERGGEHASPGHIGMLTDCAIICGTSHSFLHRGSPLHRETCQACAAVCEACAEDCDRMAADDEQMRQCGEMCHRCAESCRSMAMAA